MAKINTNTDWRRQLVLTAAAAGLIYAAPSLAVVNEAQAQYISGDPAALEQAPAKIHHHSRATRHTRLTRRTRLSRRTRVSRRSRRTRHSRY